MTKFLKILLSILIVFLSVILILFLTYVIITKDAVLDGNKLVGAGQNIVIYDDDGNEVISASLEAQKKSVSVKNLQQDTVNAFIASEDRTFYSHNGLNFKRMLKALYTNITSRSFKEGASTISQQLIKNTHLSNDKTIKRKLNEIKLTRQLEKKYEKDDILEMYLNTIYFGHNCYGLQNASEFYFNKKAENLNLTESATIVGLLTSPNNFSPFKNPEKCLKRRNTVLRSMADCGFIDETAYSNAVSEPLNAVKQANEDSLGSYINAVFDELEDIEFNYYALTDGCIIKTYLDAKTQSFVESLDYPCDNAVIITDNLSGGVKAYKTTINGAKRQPGSTVKPLFVYGPAIEEKILSPFTKILDEKINYNGYSPENFDKKYHGYVTVTESVTKSYNVPAVKTLNSLTLKKCEKYLTAMDTKLESDEQNLSLALGGMKYGLSIKELADKYSVFPNKGNYRPSHFIKEIISKEGQILYKNDYVSNNVFSEGTCSLMNEILIETTKSGTAKKLKELNFDIATKTGTCGNAEGNTDAYAISYTSENSIAVWLGDKNNKRTEITGGTDGCTILKSILEKLYADHTPSPLDTDSGTTTINIDREEYSQNNKVILADSVCPKLNLMTVKVLAGTEPKQVSNKFTKPAIPKPTISVKDGVVNIDLCHAKYYSYLIKRTQNGKTETVYDDKWVQTVVDNPKEGVFIYSVTPYFKNGETIYSGEEIQLPAVKISFATDEPQIKIPDIATKDWFNR